MGESQTGDSDSMNYYILKKDDDYNSGGSKVYKYFREA